MILELNFTDIVNNIPWNEILTVAAALGALFLKRINSNINKVKTQVENNGGSSLRDAVGRIEARLNELASTMDTMHQMSQKPMFRTNAKGECVWINTAYSLLTGKSIEDLKGHGWEIVIHPEDKISVLQEWESCVKDTRRFELPFRIQNPTNGTVTTIKCKAYPVISNKETTGYIGVWYLIDNMVASDVT